MPGLRAPTSCFTATNSAPRSAQLTQFSHALTAAATPGELGRHLDGLSAIMESHFRYEERQLLDALSELRLEADPHALLGPL
jgi:hypothetical protein